MNIEISNLPQGKQLKKITFEVEFEDKSGMSTDSNLEIVETASQHLPPDQVISSVNTADTEDIREYKPIPEEMQDTEF